jgi:heptosyltransferase III
VTVRGCPAVLLVRPDHLGDVLLTLPAASYLRRALPSVRLTYLATSAVADIPSRCPAVDRVIGLPFPDPRVEGVPEALWNEARSAGSALSNHDAALVLRPNDPVGGALVAHLGIPIRIGFPQPGTRPFLTDVVPEPFGHHAALGYRLVDALLRTLGHGPPEPAVGSQWDAVVEDIHGTRLLVERREDADEAGKVLSAVAHVSGGSPIVIHPGSGWVLKNWGASRWGRLAGEVFERYGDVPLVTGGASERALCAAVVREAAGRAVSLAGRMSLGGLAALLRRSRAFVAVDSGPLHLAAVVGCPVVGLYGPVTEGAAGPLCHRTRRRTTGVELPCRPCGEMEDPPCGAVRYPACITGIRAEEVLDALDALVTPSPVRR